MHIDSCLVMYEKDEDFGPVEFVEVPPVLSSEPLPSQKIDQGIL